MSTGGVDPLVPRRALITGGARRLGRAMALALAEDGFDPALHVRTVDADALAATDEFRVLGRRTCLVAGDLDQPEQCHRLVEEAQAALGPLGVLVNSAATFPDDRLADLDAATLEAALRVDLVAPLLLAKSFARYLPPEAHGVIVNMLDQRVLKPTARRFSYTLAKSALWTATRMMARELAPRIRVVAIGPGIAIPEPGMDEARQARIAGKAPLGWTGDAEEVVAALRYLLAARSVTGQMIIVDGGMHLA